MCADLYRLAHSTSSIIIRKYCEVNKNHIMPLVFVKTPLARKKIL